MFRFPNFGREAKICLRNCFSYVLRRAEMSLRKRPLVTICDKLFPRFAKLEVPKIVALLYNIFGHVFGQKPLFDTGGGTGFDHFYERP